MPGTGLPELIAGAQHGDTRAVDALFEEAYRELRALARLRLRAGGRVQPLNTTTLVHRTAIARAEETMKLMAEAGAPPAWRGRTLAEAAVSHLELGDIPTAAQWLEEARTLLSHSAGRMHPDLADVHVGLGRALMRQARFAEALPHLEKADAFWRGFDATNRWEVEAASWTAHCRLALRHP